MDLPADAETTEPSATLSLRATGEALVDAPLAVELRGAGRAGASVRWRARLRDDDGRVWRSTATDLAGLDAAWAPAKPAPGPRPALLSLRPLALDLRAETPDGRFAARTLTRRFADPGVQQRRWRDEVTATLHLPAGADPALGAVLLVAGDAATLAAPLLASRGALVLVVAGGPLDVARQRLAAMPRAARLTVHEPGDLVVVPPGVPVSGATPAGVAARAKSWDALLAAAGARPR